MQIHPFSEQVITYLKQLQETISDALLTTDQKLNLTQDEWQRKTGGGGRTRVFTGGDIIEQGGVNFSSVYGDALPKAATEKRTALSGKPFEAMGVSLVLHTVNPYVPAVHMNVRFFIAHCDEPVWWFGGGFDLTPYYGFDEDCIHWHKTARDACLPFGKDVYPKYKKWCDDYFYLKHREEHRGIGGLFFDDRNEGSFDDNFQFMKNIGNHFLPGYLPIIERRKNMAFGEREKSFQAYRRTRYVEFNLVYDRGTLFGLQSGGRTESILVSMPPRAEWRYQWQPEPNTPEAKLTEYYLKPRAWV